MNGWIGVDLDGTLAEYDGWKGPDHIGTPVPAMVERVKAWLAEGKRVKIFTARCWPIGTTSALTPTDEARERVEEANRAIATIQEWSKKHIGKVLPITCIKDYGMVELWDDRAVQVVKNTGARADGA